MKKLLNLHNLFLLVVFCLPLYLIKVTIFGMPSNVPELLALLAIISTVVQEKKRFLVELFAIPKLLLIGCMLIVFGLLASIFFNDNHLTGLGIIKGWFIIPMFFSFALYSTLDKALSVEKIFKSFYYSAVAVGLIASGYKIFGITTYDNRLAAFYLSPNHLAMYLSPGVFFGLYFLKKEFQQKNYSPETLSHFILLTIIFIPLYYTYSYGAWIALLISLSMILLAITPSKKLLIKGLLSLLFLFTALFIFQISTEKFSTLTNYSDRSSLASRQTIWQASLLLIAKNPLIGIGPGNFQASYLSLQKYYPPYLEWAVPQPHNIFLAFWLQTGLVGFIGFLSLLFFVFQVLWKILRDKKNTALVAPLLGFFLYTILHGLIDTTYWKNDLAYLFWVCMALSLSLYRPSQDHKNLRLKKYDHIIS